VSAGLTVWLHRFAEPAGASALLELVRTQPAVVLLALLAFAPGAAGYRRERAVLALAAAWGALLALHGSPTALTVVLAMAAAQGAHRLAVEATRARERGLGIAAAACALTAQLGLAARPAFPSSAPPPRPGLSTLAADLERLAVARGRAPDEQPVQVLGDRPDPAVAWALRRQRLVRFLAARSGTEGPPPALVLRGGVPPRAAPAGHVGAVYASPGGNVEMWVPLEP
jgi:hypothetical protein